MDRLQQEGATPEERCRELWQVLESYMQPFLDKLIASVAEMVQETVHVSATLLSRAARSHTRVAGSYCCKLFATLVCL
jgi:hypothetical protein